MMFEAYFTLTEANDDIRDVDQLSWPSSSVIFSGAGVLHHVHGYYSVLGANKYITLPSPGKLNCNLIGMAEENSN